MANIVEPGFSAKGFKFGIAVSRFNEVITKKLLNGALECLRKHGTDEKNIDVYYCPGSFELPQLAQHLVGSKKYDGVICLGCVIRGETPHFEYIAREAARGIEQVAIASKVPVSFGVLTTDTQQQALDRAGGKEGNKGWQAALSVVEMINVIKNISRRKT